MKNAKIREHRMVRVYLRNTSLQKSGSLTEERDKIRLKGLFCTQYLLRYLEFSFLYNFLIREIIKVNCSFAHFNFVHSIAIMYEVLIILLYNCGHS